MAELTERQRELLTERSEIGKFIPAETHPTAMSGSVPSEVHWHWPQCGCFLERSNIARDMSMCRRDKLTTAFRWTDQRDCDCD